MAGALLILLKPRKKNSTDFYDVCKLLVKRQASLMGKCSPHNKLFVAKFGQRPMLVLDVPPASGFP